jgi:anti-sigma-K factor RskA
VHSLSSGGSGFEPRRRLTSGSLSWLTHFWRRGAVADGMIVMAAAGSKVTFVVAPASYPECLAVAATNCNGKAMARFVTRRISGHLRTGCKCLGGAGRPEDPVGRNPATVAAQ